MNDFDPFTPQCFVNNQYSPIVGGETIDVVNPSTLDVVGCVANSSAEVLDDVLLNAKAAHKKWAALPVKERAALLHDAAHSMKTSDSQTICENLTREMGKPYPESVGEIANIAPIFEYYAELAKDYGGSVAGDIQPRSFQYKRYDSYGVSVHIVPYNYPLLILSFTVAASLAAGNAVVIKPSEISSLSTLAFMHHFRALPPGVVSCVTGDGSVGAHLVDSPNTDVVAFTGSVEVGLKVNVACAKKMKPCIIEAGGNDPIIVSSAADAEFAAAAVTCSSFHLSGQICTSTERVFVVDSIHDEFVERLVNKVSRLRVGDGFEKSEIGPLATEAARDKVARLVEQAVDQGAKIEVGGRAPENRKVGWFYEPTVLTNVSPDMDIMQQELFGPVAPVCRVADVSEGIARANDSKFGLGASIITTDLAEAMLAIEQFESGMVWVNNPLVDNDALPFGGRKLSGLGRELGREGLDSFRQAKFVTLDPTQQAYDWWYPYDDNVFYGAAGST